MSETAVRQIMGMPIGIDVRDPAGVHLEPAFEWLREVDATFSTYRDGSDISRLDRGELAVADCRPEVDEVLVRCMALQRATRGYFSVRAAGRLDPSGFVKGWAVDRAADRLTGAGAKSFCVNAGGDVFARGRPAADRLWQVGIRHPEDPERLAAVVAVEDLAVATSGAYERGSHIFDPHTGRPPAGLLSVTIVGPELATADAYATAAFAMGDGARGFIEHVDGVEAYAVRSDGSTWHTAGWLT
jgi:thiamine biosynthesis lipoprotein